jgi:predicted transcriptional regulator
MIDRAAILAALADGPGTAGELAVEFGTSPACTSDMLRKLAAAGQVTRTPVRLPGQSTSYIYSLTEQACAA